MKSTYSNILKKTIAFLLILFVILPLTACDDEFYDVDSYYYDNDDEDYGDDDNHNGNDYQSQSDSIPSLPVVSEELIAGQRAYRVTPMGGGNDAVTLMLYFCGSDLESEGRDATSDLEEIMKANISSKLNIIVETGGAKEWHNDYVDPDTNERWQITNDGPQLLEDIGKRNMAEGQNLSDFISFAAANYPADRYMLVLWDHGGGTVDGYAYDERFSSTEMMPISELNEALTNAGVVFDMIGFDCCLMGTAETAYMVEKHADFMVASQRIEPSDGWYYTPWIETLSQDTSISTPELGKLICDSYIAESSRGYYGNELTLSVTDLTYIHDLFITMSGFFEDKQDTLVNDGTFISTSHLLSDSRAITDNYDLVDLVLLVENMDGSEELLSKLDSCILYNRATIKDHNGLCLYFPYSNLKKVSSALDIFDQIGIDDTYQSFITTFANIMLGGQSFQNGGGDHPYIDEEWDIDIWTIFDWVNELLFEEYEDFYDEHSFDDSELTIDDKDDGFVLSLSDEDWELITDIIQWVYLDDGEGYIELGADNMYEFDDNGDLMIDFDYTWIHLDGNLVCFYVVEEVDDGNNWYTYGNVPILYNDEYAEIVVMWDSDNPYGYVAGWRYTGTGSGSQRGLFEMKDGMYVEFLCDYYTYDDEFDDEYIIGDMTVRGEITVSYDDIGDENCEVFYELRDIYGNSYWTEIVLFTL